MDEDTADEALREAVTAALRAYYGDTMGLVQDFLVIASGRSFDDMDAATVATLVSRPTPPIHTQLGLLEYVATRHRTSISSE